MQALLPEFERTHPGIRVLVQRIPFTAAHQKLLTAVVGRATPDVAQLGNTWLPELAALHSLLPLEPLIARSGAVDRADYFPGIWATNVVDDSTYGVPWYVDTRVLFYRSDLLAQAGYPRAPTTWSAWRDALRRVRDLSGGRRYGVLLPVNEWAQPVILGLANGAPLLRDSNSHADFSEPRFRAAMRFYVDLFRDTLAPPVSNSQIANLYQSFGNGEFVMFISGPWDVGECVRRLPASVRGKWATAPMPRPDDDAVGAGEREGTFAADSAMPGMSLAGGSSLVVFRNSEHVAAAWALVEYLSRPAQQVALYALTGDLPARRSSWTDSTIARDRYVRAFGRQLEHVESVPAIPEWDQIASQIADHLEAVVRGGAPLDTALAALDRAVDRDLEKRRWLLARDRTRTVAAR